ncbi:MAG: hypothetical protein GY711_07175 [bacterium]|nr:hypothetical protein [bacterium]
MKITLIALLLALFAVPAIVLPANDIANDRAPASIELEAEPIGEPDPAGEPEPAAERLGEAGPIALARLEVGPADSALINKLKHNDAWRMQVESPSSTFGC